MSLLKLFTVQVYFIKSYKDHKHIEDLSRVFGCILQDQKVTSKRNMKFSRFTFLFRGGLLGNMCFYRVLKTLPIVQVPADSTSFYR